MKLNIKKIIIETIIMLIGVGALIMLVVELPLK
jgi:hypothetical protein